MTRTPRSSSNPDEVEYYTQLLGVGDTPCDILAAHRRAMSVVVVLNGGFEPELLTKAEFIFDDVEEFVRKIDIIDAYFSQ